MATKKTYRTYSLKSLMLLLKDADGNRVEVRFSGGIQVDSTSRFTTSSPEIQALVEGCSGFNRDFYIESERETGTPDAPKEEKHAAVKAEAPKEEKPVMDNMKGVERFRNLVEMRNRMAELGIALPENANYSQAKAAANKEGYDFQIKKK
jgi:hypothetical protein